MELSELAVVALLLDLLLGVLVFGAARRSEAMIPRALLYGLGEVGFATAYGGVLGTGRDVLGPGWGVAWAGLCGGILLAIIGQVSHQGDGRG